MDIIKMKNRNHQRLGKFECDCGLVVKLYEDDLKNNCWQCPYCLKQHSYRPKKDSKISKINKENIIFGTVMSIFICILIVLMILFVESIHDSRNLHNKMSKKYTYSFEIINKTTDELETVYTDDSTIIGKSNATGGIEYHDLHDKTHYTYEGQPIFNVSKT